jgi:hypothetical protein
MQPLGNEGDEFSVDRVDRRAHLGHIGAVPKADRIVSR